MNTNTNTNTNIDNTYNLIIYQTQPKPQYLQIANNLYNIYNWKLIYIDEFIQFINKINTKKINNLIYIPKQNFNFDISLKISNLNINGIKIIIVDDIHNRKKRQTIYNNFNTILAPYKYQFKKFLPDIIPEKVIWFPAFAVKNGIIQPNTNPIQKILLSGTINKNIYPIRYQIYKLWKNENYKKYIHYLDKFTGNKSNTSYYKYLNKFNACFTCSGNNTFKYLVQKYIEIIGAGSLLIAYDTDVKKQLNKLGLYHMKHYIGINDINEFINTILWINDPNNTNTIYNIKLNGFNLVKEYHTDLNRTNIILNIIS